MSLGRNAHERTLREKAMKQAQEMARKEEEAAALKAASLDNNSEQGTKSALEEQDDLLDSKEAQLAIELIEAASVHSDFSHRNDDILNKTSAHQGVSNHSIESNSSIGDTVRDEFDGISVITGTPHEVSVTGSVGVVSGLMTVDELEPNVLNHVNTSNRGPEAHGQMVSSKDDKSEEDGLSKMSAVEGCEHEEHLNFATALDEALETPLNMGGAKGMSKELGKLLKIQDKHDSAHVTKDGFPFSALKKQSLSEKRVLADLHCWRNIYKASSSHWLSTTTKKANYKRLFQVKHGAKVGPSFRSFIAGMHKVCSLFIYLIQYSNSFFSTFIIACVYIGCCEEGSTGACFAFRCLHQPREAWV